jgi:hypothetical protein
VLRPHTEREREAQHAVHTPYRLQPSFSNARHICFCLCQVISKSLYSRTHSLDTAARRSGSRAGRWMRWQKRRRGSAGSHDERGCGGGGGLTISGLGRPCECGRECLARSAPPPRSAAQSARLSAPRCTDASDRTRRAQCRRCPGPRVRGPCLRNAGGRDVNNGPTGGAHVRRVGGRCATASLRTSVVENVTLVNFD